MEQDIEILEELLNAKITFTISPTDYGWKALEQLIKAYKELEEYYEEQNEVNAKFIPVSLVEEKIEEYTKLLKNCNRFSDVDRIKAINERILAYEELLEKRK